MHKYVGGDDNNIQKPTGFSFCLFRFGGGGLMGQQKPEHCSDFEIRWKNGHSLSYIITHPEMRKF